VADAADPLCLAVAPPLEAGDCLLLAAGLLWGLEPAAAGGPGAGRGAVLVCKFAGANSPVR
jgi:hypothetical protein